MVNGTPPAELSGPLAQLWRSVYRKAASLAETRTGELLRDHVYLFHRRNLGVGEDTGPFVDEIGDTMSGTLHFHGENVDEEGAIRIVPFGASGTDVHAYGAGGRPSLPSSGAAPPTSTACASPAPTTPCWSPCAGTACTRGSPSPTPAPGCGTPPPPPPRCGAWPPPPSGRTRRWAGRSGASRRGRNSRSSGAGTTSSPTAASPPGRAPPRTATTPSRTARSPSSTTSGWAPPGATRSTCTPPRLASTR